MVEVLCVCNSLVCILLEEDIYHLIHEPQLADTGIFQVSLQLFLISAGLVSKQFSKIQVHVHVLSITCIEIQ